MLSVSTILTHMGLTKSIVGRFYIYIYHADQLTCASNQALNYLNLPINVALISRIHINITAQS